MIIDHSFVRRIDKPTPIPRAVSKAEISWFVCGCVLVSKLLVCREEVEEEETEKFEGLEVKGFEDPVLLDGIKDAMKKVRTAMRWVESTWVGFVEVTEVRT